MRHRPLLVWVLAGALAVVLAYAGAVKLWDPQAFAAAIENFQIVGSGPAAVLAVYLPRLELVLAAGLLWPRWRASAALLATLLMVVFTVAVGLAWARELDISCGCFGRSTTALPWAFLRNLLLLSLATSLTFWSINSRSSARLLPPRQQGSLGCKTI